MPELSGVHWAGDCGRTLRLRQAHTLKEYAKLPRVAYIECNDTMSNRDLVEAIERALGLQTGYGRIRRRVNGIRDFLRTNKGYLLIIDETDKLIDKFTQKKMEVFRAIFDQSDVGPPRWRSIWTAYWIAACWKWWMQKVWRCRIIYCKN